MNEQYYANKAHDIGDEDNGQFLFWIMLLAKEALYLHLEVGEASKDCLRELTIHSYGSVAMGDVCRVSELAALMGDQSQRCGVAHRD